MKTFNDWKNNRKILIVEAKMLENDILHWDKESLNYWLAKFISEARKKDGNRYLGNLLVSLMAGLQQVLRRHDNRVDFSKEWNSFIFVKALMPP